MAGCYGFLEKNTDELIGKMKSKDVKNMATTKKETSTKRPFVNATSQIISKGHLHVREGEVGMNDCSMDSGNGAMSFEHLAKRLDRIEALLTSVAEQRTAKEFYSTAEIAEILGRAEFTVREWCRNGRAKASKRLTGRGNSKEWILSNEELLRIQNEGLLPPPDPFQGLRKND